MAMNAEGQYWKEAISLWAKELGFIAVGFTSSEIIAGLAEVLREREEKGFATPLEEKNLRRRYDPKEVWPNCRSVCSLAFPLPLSTPPLPGEGIMARSAVGEDYHTVVRKRLVRLVERIMHSGWDSEPPRFQVDTGPLVERAFAVRAGIGWAGKNQQLIIPGYGSFVALALLLLDKEIPPDKAIPAQCGSCVACIEACPSQVLGKDSFQAVECLSYLTQKKELLSEEEQHRLGGRIFGCDSCQEACPHNYQYLKRERQEGGIFHRGVDLESILNLTKKEFNKTLKSTAAGWRGKGILQRNALLALRHNEDPRLKAWLEKRKGASLPTSLSAYIDK